MGIDTTSDQNRPCPSCGSEHARLRYLEPPFRIVRCRRCGLVYLANPPEEDRLYEDYYEGGGFEPSEYRPDSTDPRLGELHAINTQRVDRLRALKPGGRLLDVGCGRGFFLKTAVEAGYSVHGIDVSERAVRFASAFFGITAGTESLDTLAQGGPSYDVVTLWHVLEHFADPFDALSLVHETLAPGGVCVLEVPNLHSLKFTLARRKWQGGNHPLYHRTFFTAGSLRRALVKTGFAPVERLQLSYRLPARSPAYEGLKRALNAFALDAFLDFAGWKK